MNIAKTGITLASTLGLAFILSGCVSSDDLAESLLGTVTINGTVVDASNNDLGLQGVSLKATTDGIQGTPRDYDSETVTTDGSGNFNMTVVKDLPVYLHLTKADYATFNTAFGIFTADGAIQDIPMITSADAEAMIDAAFPGSNLNLADRAWVAVNVVDTNGEDLAGATLALNNFPSDFAYNNLNNCVNDYSGTAPTADCTATRVGPMYIAYYVADEAVEVTVSGAMTGTQTVLVKVGEVAIVEFQQ